MFPDVAVIDVGKRPSYLYCCSICGIIQGIIAKSFSIFANFGGLYRMRGEGNVPKALEIRQRANYYSKESAPTWTLRNASFETHDLYGAD